VPRLIRRTVNPNTPAQWGGGVGIFSDVLVLPGHGDDTTIGAERPHFDEWVDRGW